MRTILVKAFKSAVLCAGVYLLLLGMSFVVTVVSRTLAGEAVPYAFEDVWYIKYPLFAAVIYLVFSDRL